MLDSYTRWQAVNVDLSGKLQKAQIDLQASAASEPLSFEGLSVARAP